MKNNFVRKHMHLTSKPSVIAHKKTSLKSEATLRDAAQSLSEEIVGPKTITFVSDSAVCWDESEDCCESVLNSVNCSSVSIDDYEENK